MANSKYDVHEWLVEDTAENTFDEYCFRYVYRLERAAACACCKSTISAQSATGLESMLQQHYLRNHRLRKTDLSCNLCCCSIGPAQQRRNSVPAHATSNRHTKYMSVANRVCATCAAVNPTREHNPDHVIREFEDVLMGQGPELSEDSPDMGFFRSSKPGEPQAKPASKVGNSAKADIAKMLLACSVVEDSGDRCRSLVPCGECFDADIGSLIPTDWIIEGGLCQVCRYSGNSNAGRSVTWRRKKVFPDTFCPKKFKPQLTKEEWKTLSDEWQDCYELRAGKATLVVSSARAEFSSWAEVPLISLLDTSGSDETDSAAPKAAEPAVVVSAIPFVVADSDTGEVAPEVVKTDDGAGAPEAF